MKFELTTLTSYDEAALKAELSRVSALLPVGELSVSAFNKLSKVHSSTLIKRFGSWRKALGVAGLEDRFDGVSEAYSREEIIQALQDAAREVPDRFLTRREFTARTGITDHPMRRLFGSFSAALEAAGLSASPLGRRYTDTECFENLISLWTALGRQPTFGDLRSELSTVGPKAYVVRWGSWRKALAAFVTKANEDIEAAALQDVEISNVAAPVRSKRTPREISLGLRYVILRRDQFRCVTCGRSPATHVGVVLHVDHILAWSHGGETVPENLRALCEDCNLGKGPSSA